VVVWPGAWQTLPSVDHIVDQLQYAYHLKNPVGELGPILKDWDRRKTLCATRARQYDYETVVAPAWDEYLRRAPWSPVGGQQ